MSENLKAGVIGLGIMGGSFARNILDAGFSVVGYDIVESNVSALVEAGGQAASSVRELATQVDVIITSLPSTSSFHEVMTGEYGISSAERKGLIVVECSTLKVEDKQKAHDALHAVDTILLDAPVSGTGSQAITRDLSVYVSGEILASIQCQPILDAIANHTFYVGEFGNGSKMKFVANVLVSIHNGNSRIFELRGPMMVENDYSNATMKMDVWQKDLQVISEFAVQHNCPIPLFSESRKVYDIGMEMGLDKLDTASVCQVLEQVAGVDRK